MRIFRLKRFSNLSIRSKLFALFLLVVTLPFLILLFIYLNVNQRESKAQALFSSHKVLDETRDYLSFKAAAVLEVANFIAFSELVQTKAIADPGPYEDVNIWHNDAVELSKFLNQFRYNEDISTIQLYMKQGLAGATENPDYLNMGKVEREQWFQNFSQSRSAYTWVSSSVFGDGTAQDRITLLRKIPNAHNIQQFDGIVRVQTKPDAMKSVLDHAIITPSASAVLFNSNGDFLSTSAGFRFNKQQFEGMLEQDAGSGQASDWNDQVTVDGKRVLFGLQSIPHTDMKVALIIPESDISSSTIKSRNRLLSIFLLIVPLMLPLSYFAAGSATKRIRLLIAHIRKTKLGNFQLEALPANEDEIGELTRNINGMVHNISHLMDETYALGREVKNKELKALQAQINPHFLYNTLDLINVLAIESGAKEITRVVGELAVFYKLSLSNGQEKVTLENELKHVEAYVHIQNMRFGNGIVMGNEVPRELYNCVVPKIILQPLVENSILHGIMEKDDEIGMIRIGARSENGDVIVEVADDGVGMDEPTRESLFKMTGNSKYGGYGVRNIQERLQLFYGTGYGLEYDSTLGKGTRVKIRIPERREDSTGD